MRIARPQLFLSALALSACIVALDQASKVLLFEIALRGVEEIPVTSFFSLVKRYNFGISFSFLSTDHPIGPWALSALALLISSVLVVWLARTTDRTAAIGLGLILGGAIGNVMDRLRIGAVQDFLLFYWRDWAWPAFNLADSAITLGVGVLILDGFLQGRRGASPAKPD